MAGGTGDIALRIAPMLSSRGRIIIADNNAAMIARGRDRLLDAGAAHVRFTQTNGEHMCFADNSFDIVVCAFGMRNMTQPAIVAAEIQRVLRTGGRVIILEFSQPQSAIVRKIYNSYSFHVLPRLGKYIAGQSDAYRYLVESIRRHPDQHTFAQLLSDVGFSAVRFENISDGIVALHTGIK